jgi:hypothetical protein
VDHNAIFQRDRIQLEQQGAINRLTTDQPRSYFSDGSMEALSGITLEKNSQWAEKSPDLLPQ